MFADLIDSARELRNPLTVGYSVLFTLWIWFGDAVKRDTSHSELAVRLRDGLASLGNGTKLALVTFVAAMIGSVLWTGVVQRLVAVLMRRFDHPDWDAYIEAARTQVQRYEEYRVVAAPGSHAVMQQGHTVPSPHWGEYLHQRAEERARKAAEAIFRVTLAVALVPVTFSLALRGGGMWWLTLGVIGVPWLDVALMKHSTQRLIRGYEIEDLEAQLRATRKELAEKSIDANFRSRLEANIKEMEPKLEQLRAKQSGRSARIFATIEGRQERGDARSRLR